MFSEEEKEQLEQILRSHQEVNPVHKEGTCLCCSGTLEEGDGKFCFPCKLEGTHAVYILCEEVLKLRKIVGENND